MIQGHNGDPAWVASWKVQTYSLLLPVQIFGHQEALHFLYLFLNRIFKFTVNNLADAFIQSDVKMRRIIEATVYKCHDKSQLV